MAEAPFLSLESSKTATFLVGSESNVRPLGPLPAGPVRPLGLCCLGVAEAPFLSLETHVSHPGAVFRTEGVASAGAAVAAGGKSS